MFAWMMGIALCRLKSRVIDCDQADCWQVPFCRQWTCTTALSSFREVPGPSRLVECLRGETAEHEPQPSRMTIRRLASRRGSVVPSPDYLGCSTGSATLFSIRVSKVMPLPAPTSMYGATAIRFTMLLHPSRCRYGRRMNGTRPDSTCLSPWGLFKQQVRDTEIPTLSALAECAFVVHAAFDIRLPPTTTAWSNWLPDARGSSGNAVIAPERKSPA